MKVIQRIIYTGFAAVTIASASMPVFPDSTPAPSAAREGDAARAPVADGGSSELIIERR